jgi:hypothetical protein
MPDNKVNDTTRPMPQPTEVQRREANGEVRIPLSPQLRMRRQRIQEPNRIKFDFAFVAWVKTLFGAGQPVLYVTFMGLNHQIELELPADVIDRLHQLAHPDAG